MVTDLLVGDYAEDPEGFEKAKKVFNILGDTVETVTPYLAEKVLAAQKNGARVAWLTNGKATRRFMTRRVQQARPVRRGGPLMCWPPAGSTSATEYGVALAVEDFVPCVLALAALVVLAQAVRRRLPAAYPGRPHRRPGDLGGRLRQGDLEAPGRHRLLGVPVARSRCSSRAWPSASRPSPGPCSARSRDVRSAPLWFVLFPLAAGVGAAWMSISAGEYTNWPLLIAAAVGATFLGVTLAATAFRAGKPSVGVLFVIYTLGTNILPPLAAQPKQSAELQWAEQLTNSAVQLCFLLGALWLREHLTSRRSHESADDKTGVPA